jgi:hypothetical protein
MGNPLGYVPGFHIPGTTIPIGAVVNRPSTLPQLPDLTPAERQQKSAYRPAMEAHATSLRKRIRHLTERLALGGVPLTPRNRPVRRVKKFMGGYRTEFEQLDPAWPIIALRHGRTERLLGVTANGDIVPMEPSGHWFEDRFVSVSGYGNLNRDVIDKLYQNGEPIAIAIVKALETIARDTGISVDPWELVKRPETLPVVWNVGNCDPGDWVLRDE